MTERAINIKKYTSMTVIGKEEESDHEYVHRLKENMVTDVVRLVMQEIDAFEASVKFNRKEIQERCFFSHTQG